MNRILFFKGVSHVDELLLMFTSNLTGPLTRPDDVRVSETLIDLWTSFAAQGYYIHLIISRPILQFLCPKSANFGT